MHGPPRTEKTFLAQCLAGTLGIPCLLVNASQLSHQYINQTAANIHELFTAARRAASQHPSKCALVILDEIDAIGSVRSSEVAAAARDQNNTVSALLTEMSGLASETGCTIIVIGTTNRTSA